MMMMMMYFQVKNTPGAPQSQVRSLKLLNLKESTWRDAVKGLFKCHVTVQWMSDTCSDHHFGSGGGNAPKISLRQQKKKKYSQNSCKAPFLVLSFQWRVFEFDKHPQSLRQQSLMERNDPMIDASPWPTWDGFWETICPVKLREYWVLTSSSSVFVMTVTWRRDGTTRPPLPTFPVYVL